MMMLNNNYVLITAAYNEGEHIGNTIESVLKQTIKPVKWVIVSDGSTDNTDRIIINYTNRYHDIIFIRREKKSDEPGFVSKVMALKTGYAALYGIPYRFIGILDADVSFEPNYFKSIISLFDKNPKLGIAGGFIYELENGLLKSRFANSTESVAGAVQLFRKECYEAIGGHQPARFGGEDSICEILARMKGWQVKSYPNFIVHHHKTSHSKRGIFRDVVRQGRMDYTIGTSVLFEIAKCLRRTLAKPYLFIGLLRMCGFIGSYLMRDNRVVTNEVRDYAQREQLRRIKQVLRLI